eukprot:gene26613-biopygen16998
MSRGGCPRPDFTFLLPDKCRMQPPRRIQPHPFPHLEMSLP